MSPPPDRADELLALGRFAQAEAVARRAVARDPTSVEDVATLAHVLLKRGDRAQAEHHLRRVVALLPAEPHARANLGKCLWELGKAAEAEQHLRQAWSQAPSETDIAVMLSTLLLGTNRPAAALALVEPLLNARPLDHVLLSHASRARHGLGKTHAAGELLDRARAAAPGDPATALACATFSNYDPRADGAAVRAAHQRWAELVDGGTIPPEPKRTPPAANGPLRVGLLSPDLRRHACACFLRPLLQGLRTPGRRDLVLACYSTATAEDDHTPLLRAGADLWRHVPSARAAELAAQVERDAIDVLIDAGGLTAGGRPEVFLRRPAPVQVAWLGYPSTTGLSVFDARLVDALTDPPDLASAWSVEPLERIDPCFLAFAPLETPPPVVAPSRAGVVFGSFNAVVKLNGEVLSLWARVLAAVPGSRLLLKVSGCTEAEGLTTIAAECARAGIPEARLDLLPPAPTYAEHLAAYAGVDVALDTFPYNGTTTTLEAFTMGVPVVTLAGSAGAQPHGAPARHASRVGVSLLSAVGRERWIAETPEAYIRIAVGLANNPAERAAEREGLPAALRQSPLGDAPGFARRFEDALRRVVARVRERSSARGTRAVVG